MTGSVPPGRLSVASSLSSFLFIIHFCRFQGTSTRFQSASTRREQGQTAQLRHHKRILKFLVFPVVVIAVELVVIVVYDLFFRFLPEVRSSSGWFGLSGGCGVVAFLRERSKVLKIRVVDKKFRTQSHSHARFAKKISGLLLPLEMGRDWGERGFVDVSRDRLLEGHNLYDSLRRAFPEVPRAFGRNILLRIWILATEVGVFRTRLGRANCHGD